LGFPELSLQPKETTQLAGRIAEEFESAFRLLKQVELLKLAGFRFEGAGLKARTVEQQHRHRLLAGANAFETELTEQVLIFFGHNIPHWLLSLLQVPAANKGHKRTVVQTSNSMLD